MQGGRNGGGMGEELGPGWVPDISNRASLRPSYAVSLSLSTICITAALLVTPLHVRSPTRYTCLPRRRLLPHARQL